MAATTLIRRSVSRVSFATTVNRSRLLISAISISKGRLFCSSPCLSSENLRSPISNESFLHEILSIRKDVESLRQEIKSLQTGIRNHAKIKLQGTEFTEAMATYYNTNTAVTSGANESLEDPSPFSEAMAIKFNTIEKKTSPSEEATATPLNTIDSEKKTSPFSEAMATHYNTVVTIRFEGTNEDENKTRRFAEAMATHFEQTGRSEEIDNHFNSESVDDNKMDDSVAEDNKVDDSVAKSKEESVFNLKEKEEILHAKGTNIPQDFPFKVEKDITGTEEIYLSRELEGERIKIKVNKFNLYNAAGVLRSEKYIHLKDRAQFSMSITVEVSCAASNLRKVVLDCFGYRNNLMIEYVKNPEDGTDNQGLQFNKLYKDLQDGFYEYLETRGINSSTINILYEYMLEKMHREYVTFFHNFRKILDA